MNLLAIFTEARRWVLLALILVAAGAVAFAAHSWRRAGDAERELRATKARAELRAKGDVPVEPVPDARPALAAAMQQNEALAGQVAKLQKDLRGAKPALVIHAETDAARVGNALPSGSGGPTANPDESRGPEGSQSAESPSAATPCLLASGDRLKLKLDMAELRGDDGVAGVAGAIEAWALRDMAEPVLLTRQPFAAKLTSVVELAPPASAPKLPRFALGARAWWPASGSAPSSAEVNAGLRLLSGWWVDAALRSDGSKAAGVRREF